MELSAAERARYQRHLSLAEVGEAGQRRLRDARVLVVGAGGLGSPVALYLAAAGIGTVGLADGDRVELSNLQRQVLYDTSAVGRPKTEVAAARLRALNADIRVVEHRETLRAASIATILGGYDVVVDGTDRISTRYVVNDACVLLRKPLVAAAIHRFEGQAFTYVPDRGPCYRCLFPAADDRLAPNCADAGVLGVLPGVLGALQATEAVKLVLGIGTPLVGRLLVFDALEMRFDEFRFARRADCAVCGDRPTITSLAQSVADELPAIGPVRLAEMLRAARAAGPPLTLIDVREPAEYAVGHLRGAVNVPLAGVAQALGALPASGTFIFMCRSGGRSASACRLAREAGREGVLNLEGGLLAWAREVDPGLRVAEPP